jgi:hypothetical protein
MDIRDFDYEPLPADEAQARAFASLTLSRLIVSSSATEAAHDASQATQFVVRPATGGAEGHCRLLRDVFGNPFRPVALDPRWRTPTAIALARAIYEGRAFDRLPILADALQEAGCEEADVLGHCRSDGPHVRGCWVADLVLGKE